MLAPTGTFIPVEGGIKIGKKKDLVMVRSVVAVVAVFPFRTD